MKSITISQDLTTGNVTGTLNTTEYAITGGRKEYEEVKVDIDTGIESIFGEIAVEGVDSDEAVDVEENIEE